MEYIGCPFPVSFDHRGDSEVSLFYSILYDIVNILILLYKLHS